jgi:23S rRNA (cytosine1962-C5)-methyltransferase
VALRKKVARAVHAGHPWIYRDAITPPKSDPVDGAVVLVTNDAGRPIGRGFWTRTTPLAIRMLTTEASDDLDTLLAARLQAALEVRLAVLDRARTNAFRWVHGEADRLPGVHLDVYDDVAAVRFDGPGARAFYLARPFTAQVMTAGARLGLSALIERKRGPRGGASGDDDDGDARALAGVVPEGERTVLENGLTFGVDLAHGQKGGLFLDQRDNRERVRAMAQGRRVLNLFGYTGGFSVYAAAGQASATTTVDVAAGAIASARRNFERNGFALASHEFVAADVFAFVAEATRARRRWDLVISDPPSFAPSRKSLPTALAAYRRLHRLCAGLVQPGGVFCAASCSSHVSDAAFLETVEAGCREAGRRFVLEQLHGAGPDHPVADVFPEGRYLKFAIGTLT